MTIEERMVAARWKLRLQQKDVAEQAGVSRATVSRAEAGKSRLSGVSRDRIEAWLARNETAWPACTCPEPDEEGRLIRGDCPIHMPPLWAGLGAPRPANEPRWLDDAGRPWPATEQGAE